jgi:hypothetical protein
MSHKSTLLVAMFLLIQSCTNYSTNLNEMQKLKIKSFNDIKKGQGCTSNLFGGLTLPYFGDTAIKLSGDESVMAAIKDGGINKVYAVDKMVKNYVLYSKRCTIVFGQ